MAAEVEAIALELDRLGDPADGSVGLEDVAGTPSPGKHPGGRQARWPSSEDCRPYVVSVTPLCPSQGNRV